MSNKRRIALFTAALLFILSGCSSSMSDIQINPKVKTGKDMTFFVSTDIHYFAKTLTDGGPAFEDYVTYGDGKRLNYIDEIMSTFTYEIKNKKPEVLIISGDLTTNGEKASHLELSDRLKEIESSGTEVFVIPGNHDILNPMACEFIGEDQFVAENISIEDFSKIYGDFGYSEAISRDKDTLSYLAAPSEELWLLMLDTSKYKDNPDLPFPQGDGEINKETLKWIKKCSALAKEKGASIVTVMHHNLIDHSEVIRNGYTLNNNEEVIKVFKDLGLNTVLSGHIHTQDISSYGNEDNKMYDIVTSSLAVYPNQYGILKYSSESSALDYSTSRLDVEGWAKAVNAKRESLYNFSASSAEFFGQLGYDRAYKELMRAETYTKDQVMLMSETMKILNLRYFSGTEYLNAKDVVNSEGYKLWMDTPESFHKKYIMTIISDKDTDDNNLKIQLQNKR